MSISRVYIHDILSYQNAIISANMKGVAFRSHYKVKHSTHSEGLYVAMKEDMRGIYLHERRLVNPYFFITTSEDVVTSGAEKRPQRRGGLRTIRIYQACINVVTEMIRCQSQAERFLPGKIASPSTRGLGRSRSGPNSQRSRIHAIQY